MMSSACTWGHGTQLRQPVSCFLPLPHHAQIATDSERTIQLRRDFLVDGRFESIPVKVAIKMIATTINNKKAPEIAAVILPALLIVRFLIFFLCQS